MFHRAHLDQVVLDVELVLLSVVQAAALSTLAIEATPLLREPTLVACVFVAIGFLFILNFWSVAIIHAISFMTWPMDLVHYFFYFGLVLVECLTFGQMDRPDAWFGYSLVAFGLTQGLYVYDYRMILQRRRSFESTPEGRALYEHIRRRQALEMKALIPGGMAFNLIAFLVVRARPEATTVLALLQLVLSIVFMMNFVQSFAERRERISACIEE